MERNHLGTHKKNFWSNSHSLSNNIHFVFNKVAQCVPTYSCLAASPIDKRFWQMHAKDIHVHVLWYSTTLWQSFSCCLYEKWKFKISSWCISESTQNMHVIVISPKKENYPIYRYKHDSTNCKSDNYWKYRGYNSFTIAASCIPNVAFMMWKQYQSVSQYTYEFEW